MSRSMERYYWLKSHGICVWCGQEDAATGGNMCLICAAKQNDNAKISYYKNKNPEKSEREKQKKREIRRFRKSNGLCIQCGDVAVFGRVRCEKCLRKCQKSTAKYREPILKRFKECGLCLWCGAEPVEGRLYCPSCLERKQQMGRELGRRYGGKNDTSKKQHEQMWRQLRAGKAVNVT